jgi:hypothetical protein
MMTEFMSDCEALSVRRVTLVDQEHHVFPPLRNHPDKVPVRELGVMNNDTEPICEDYRINGNGF